jgi:hypothetical protein
MWFYSSLRLFLKHVFAKLRKNVDFDFAFSPEIHSTREIRVAVNPIVTRKFVFTCPTMNSGHVPISVEAKKEKKKNKLFPQLNSVAAGEISLSRDNNCNRKRGVSLFLFFFIYLFLFFTTMSRVAEGVRLDGFLFYFKKCVRIPCTCTYIYIYIYIRRE